MIQIREQFQTTETGEIDIHQWAERLLTTAHLPKTSLEPILQATSTAKMAKLRANSELDKDNKASRNRNCSFLNGLRMADILADLHLDQEALIAAIIYSSVNEQKVTLEEIKDAYGEGVARLIEGVQCMPTMRTLHHDKEQVVFGKQSAEQVESIRRMLVAMVDDVRIAVIKLSERICAIRAAKDAGDDVRRNVAREVSDIYAPLAHRLGIGHIKWELEDLAFRYLKPQEYKNIARLLDDKRRNRQIYINKVVKTLNIQVKKSGIDAAIYGRAKNIYSIWRKMQKKGIEFSEVYDISAVRILVPKTRDCYEVLGIIHAMWRNIPNEFDDYIAAPKENGYRSLHTAVFGPENKTLEVQIRSQNMHEEAEFGVCSHWRYKGNESSQASESYEKKIEWLRNLLDWKEELDVNLLDDNSSHGIEQDRIYLFTPEGHVVDLPLNATPLDFAYHIHTEIGHRCRGAKVNGRIVTLNYRLKTSDQVEVLTGNREIPSRDWLIESLGYLKTSRARAKVRQWFGAQAREENIADGRAVFDRELKRLGIHDLDFEKLVKRLKLKTLEELHAAIGSGDISIGRALKAVQRQIAPPEKPTIHLVEPSTGVEEGDIFIEGVGNLVTTIANCCRPLPGDEISGYITLARGVSIHRKDCHNLLQLQNDEPERIMQVDWGNAPKQRYSVDIVIKAYDRRGLLHDTTAVLDNAHINVNAIETLTDKGQHTVDMLMTIEIRDFTELSRVLARINQLPNIASAQRKHD
ncbi:MAG: GTP pyrophosphokinase [Cellvibrionaceae bacterium]|jgi:GTP pyrophosphokinase